MPRLLLCFFIGLLTPSLQAAAVKSADPTNYRQILRSLEPGDTLQLSAGVYERGLPITDCHGTPDAWITIEGPASCGVVEIRQSQEANCVELTQCSHLILRRLSILGTGPSGIPGLFGISAKGGTQNLVHHITIEDCLISGWNTSQQAVGISTKTPTWGWIIRRNIIRDCGTGLYLGNSNGNDAFIGGIIEHNLVDRPTGYCMEIKFQKPRPTLPDLPTQPSRTLIRHNVFSKNDTPSPDGDRPNVLVGGFPSSGPGQADLYEIYGNLFWNNPREALLQASGRVTIHDNIFINQTDSTYAAITLRHHDLPLALARIYHNTIYTTGPAINVAAVPMQGFALTHNALFTSASPLRLHPDLPTPPAQLTASLTDAPNLLKDPTTLKFQPLPSHRPAPALSWQQFETDTDYDRDFEQQPKTDGRHHGAYSHPHTPQSWPLQRERKP